MEEKELLRVNSTGITKLEEILSNGVDPNCNSFDNKKSLDIILRTRRFDLLPKVTIKCLLRKRNRNETYIDYILRRFKRTKTINISLFDPFDKGASISDIAQLYIKYAQHDLLGYLPELTKENLLQISKNKRFLFVGSNMLEILLSRNKILTLEKIIPSSLQTDFDIVVALNRNDIKQKKVKIDFKGNSLANNYIESFNKKYKSMYQSLPQDKQLLIDKLYNAFLNTSDKKALYTVINSYVEQLKNNNQYAIYEINQLIDIKEKDPNFDFKDSTENYYNSKKNIIYISTNLVSVVNHEIGHALYNNLSPKNDNEGFYNVINNIKYDPSFYQRVADFSRVFHNHSNRIRVYAISKYDSIFYDLSSMKQQEEIQKYLNKQKKEKIDEYVKKGYSREELEVIFKDSFTVKEFLKQHEKIQCFELKATMMKAECDIYLSVADIIDAITKGEFAAGMLKDSWGKEILPCAGHGLFYYNVLDSLVFDEVIANYSEIVKSNNKDKGIELLRTICGNELVEYLDYYYNNMIINGVKKEEAYGRN